MTDLADLEGAVANLREHQQQLDADGIMVGVSRQALDIVLTAITTLQAEKDALREDIRNALLERDTALDDFAAAEQALADEREACAKLADEQMTATLDGGLYEGARRIAAAIRSRASEDKPNAALLRALPEEMK